MAGEKTFGEQLDKVRAAICERARNSPRLGFVTSFVQRTLQCGYNHAALVTTRLERDKFISEPDVNGHRRLL